MFQCDINKLARTDFIGYIRAVCNRFAAFCANCFRHVLNWIVRQSAYDDARTFLCELMRDRLTNAGSRTSNYCYFPFKPSIIGPIAAVTLLSHTNKFRAPRELRAAEITSLQIYL